MSYRTHTADVSNVSITYDTVLTVDQEVGYEHTPEADDFVLMLDDGGNQEAVVLTGSSEDFTEFARRILAVVTDSGSLEHRVAADLHKMHDSTGISVDDWPDGRTFIEKYDGPVDLHRDA